MLECNFASQLRLHAFRWCWLLAKWCALYSWQYISHKSTLTMGLLKVTSSLSHTRTCIQNRFSVYTYHYQSNVLESSFCLHSSPTSQHVLHVARCFQIVLNSACLNINTIWHEESVSQMPAIHWWTDIKDMFHPLVNREKSSRDMFHLLVNREWSSRDMFHPLVNRERSSRDIFHPLVNRERLSRDMFHPLVNRERSSRDMFHPLVKRERSSRDMHNPLVNRERSSRDMFHPLANRERSSRDSVMPIG